MQPLEVAPAARFPKNSTTDRLRPVRVPPWLRTGMKVASTLAPAAAARLARKLFFTPPRVPLREEERAVLARGERFSLVARGAHGALGADPRLVGRVAGHVWGAGPTALLVHGWGGHSGQMTPLVDPLVAAGFRVVAIDLPGHGESAGRVSSLVHCAAALAGVSALFGPVRGLAAHSFGAAASTWAMARGLAVERAVFFAPPARFDSFWLRFRTGVGLSPAVMERMLLDAESWLDVRFDGMAPADLAPRMTAPLLVLHDPEDREMPFEEGAELARRWPGAALARAERCGHLRILRDARWVAEAAAFLAG
jgi:pimeloyl-ACP methyl ester carboxylesterase